MGHMVELFRVSFSCPFLFSRRVLREGPPSTLGTLQIINSRDIAIIPLLPYPHIFQSIILRQASGRTGTRPIFRGRDPIFVRLRFLRAVAKDRVVKMTVLWSERGGVAFGEKWEVTPNEGAENHERAADYGQVSFDDS